MSLMKANEPGIVVTSELKALVSMRTAGLPAHWNLFFRDKVQHWQALEGNWRTDLERFARTVYEHDSKYIGVAAYLAQHNRFRLFQFVQEGETDYGLEFFDRAASILRSAGFTPPRAALAYHLVMQHVVASVGARMRHLLPADHRDFIRAKLQSVPQERYPGAHFLAEAFPELSADQSFDAGLTLLLDGIGGWLGRDRRSAG